MSDEESAIFEPFLASLAEGGRAPKNHRKVLDGVFWMNRTGAPLARYTRGTGQLELGAQAVSQLVSLRRVGRAVAGVGEQRRAGMGGFRLCWTTAVSATQGICSRSSNGRNPPRPCENSSGESRRTPICVARCTCLNVRFGVLAGLRWMTVMGAIPAFEVLRRNFGNPPYGVILCNPASNRSRPIPGAQNRLQKNAT